MLGDDDNDDSVDYVCFLTLRIADEAAKTYSYTHRQCAPKIYIIIHLIIIAWNTKFRKAVLLRQLLSSYLIYMLR